MSKNRNDIETVARELFAQAQRGDDVIEFPWIDEASKAKSRAFRAETLGSLGGIRALEFLGTKRVMQGKTPEIGIQFPPYGRERKA